MTTQQTTGIEIVGFDTWGFDVGSIPFPSAEFDKWSKTADSYFFDNGNYVELWLDDDRLDETEIESLSQLETLLAEYC